MLHKRERGKGCAAQFSHEKSLVQTTKVWDVAMYQYWWPVHIGVNTAIAVVSSHTVIP